MSKVNEAEIVQENWEWIKQKKDKKEGKRHRSSQARIY